MGRGAITNRETIEAIKAALQTDEDGENLVAVARAACQAEQQLAAFIRHWNDENMRVPQ